MGRMTTDSEVFSLFEVIEYQKYKCSLCSDNHSGIKGNVSHLRRHLERCHPSAAQGTSTSSSSKHKLAEQEMITRKIIRLEVDVNDLRRGLVLQTVGKCLSFNSFNDEGFKLAFDPYFKALGMTVNRSEIRKLIIFAGNHVMRQIEQKLSNSNLSYG